MGHAGPSSAASALIDEVWDVNWFGSTTTLDVHVSGLRQKLGDDLAEPRATCTPCAAWASAFAGRRGARCP